MYEVDRTRRVSELLRRELATLIPREVNDNRIRHVSINGVRVSKDLKNATVYFSSLDPIAAQDTTDATAVSSSRSNRGSGRGDSGKQAGAKAQPSLEKLLNNASGYLRHLLSQHAELRVTPNLRFRYDDTIRRGVEMSSLIDRLNRKKSSDESE